MTDWLIESAWPLWVLLAGGVGLTALCSGFETGMYAMSPVRLRLRLADGGDLPARRLRAMLDRRESLLVGLLAGNNIAHYLATVAVLLLFVRSGTPAHSAESWTTLTLTPLLFVFGEMVPKNVFRVNADRLVFRYAGMVRWLLSALTACGLLHLLRGLVALPARLFRSASPGEALGSREAIRSMVFDTAASGVLTPFQVEVADNVLGIASVTLRTVMVPLPRVVMISDDYTREEFRQLAAHFSYSHVPVYARRDRTRLLGVVRIVEGLMAPAEGWKPTRLARPLPALEVTLPVLPALTKLREQRAVMAAVVDASGRAVGIVTVKDLVEEIVGELAAW